jgi:hypothetical protein
VPKPYNWQYPGMLSNEALIWDAFLAANPGIVAQPDYNVRVGKGMDPGPTISPSIRAGAIANSQLRLDAVGRTANGWTIFEVKQRCRAGAVGQLIQYKLLYADAFPNNSPLSLAVVTDVPTLGLDRLCTHLGVTLYVQPVTFTPVS